jgi:hypothetical protein
MNESAVVDRGADWHRLKSLVLDSVSSPITKRVYNLGLDEFFEWYGREPRPGFTKATVAAWRVAPTYVEFHQATNRTFDPYMPIVVVGSFLDGIVLAILSPGIHSVSGELAIAGSLCYVAVPAIALSTNVRINQQIARWSVEMPPDNWRRFAPIGFDFTFSVLFFHFQDWPATSLPVL